MSFRRTQFSEAVYQRQNSFDFGPTEFTRQELRILTLVDGRKTVRQIAHLVESDTSTLLPAFSNLIRLGLIQTDGCIVSEEESDILFIDNRRTADLTPVFS